MLQQQQRLVLAVCMLGEQACLLLQLAALIVVLYAALYKAVCVLLFQLGTQGRQWCGCCSIGEKLLCGVGCRL